MTDSVSIIPYLAQTVNSIGPGISTMFTTTWTVTVSNIFFVSAAGSGAVILRKFKARRRSPGHI